MPTGTPGLRRGLVRKLEIALSNGPAGVLQFAYENSIPEPNSGCWLWTGPVSGYGYGWLRDPRRPIDRLSSNRCFVHRIVCEAVHGDMAPDIVTRHRCDNSFCVNPDHLLPGTRLDNSHDAVERGRLAPVDGERNPRAKLTEADVREIRASRRRTSVLPFVEKFGVSESLVRQIRRGVIWQGVI